MITFDFELLKKLFPFVILALIIDMIIEFLKRN